MTAEFLRFIEALLLDSVVLLKVDGIPVATGFFVSEHGDVCSCHHFLPGRFRSLTATWRGKEVPIAYERETSQSALDFAMFTIEPAIPGDPTTPLPILDRELDQNDRFDSLLAAGFAGISDPYAPARMRLFDGTLAGVAQYHNPPTGGNTTQIESLDITIAKGMSGAPIFDARLFRVVGYVKGHLDEVHERLGRACTLDQLVLRRPDLQPSWRRAHVAMNAKKIAFFRDNGTPFPPELLTWQDIQALSAAHNKEAIAALAGAGIYNADLFVPRGVAGKLEQFLSNPDYSFAVVAGVTGTGKTNLLADLATRLSDADSIVIFVACGNLATEDAIGDLCRLLGCAGNTRSLFVSAAQSPVRAVRLIFDGFNEWRNASRSSIKRMLEQIESLATIRSGFLKVILSVRTEFLKEKVPELVVRDASASRDLWLNSVFQHTDADPATGAETTRSVIELPRLSPPHNDDTSEQEIIYERYRILGSVEDASGRRIGIRPKTSYAELPQRIRHLLDRPLFLKFFMIRYHNQEVPHVAVRSQFLSEIVTPDTAGWAASTSAWERAQVFLGYLANFLLSLGESSYPQFLLARETWYDQEIVTLLLAHTFILARLETKGSVSSRLGFSSDWLFEYFLALYLREESLHATGVEARTANINEKMSNSRRPKGNDPLIGALNYFAEWALVNALEIFALLLRVASIDDPPGLRSAFLETLMESVRAQSGFDKPIQTDSGNTIKSFCALMAEMRECLAPSGFSRILLYIERMGDDTTSDALCLLTLEPKLWEGLDSASFADFISIRALKHFKADRIDLAMNDLRELKLEDISGEVRGRYSFVMGHCLQFKREYAEALRLFSVCRDAPGFYGSMCRHQIAFIQFFQQSDYRGAAEMLSTARSSGKWSNSASKLLFATCLIELGRYSEAADLLNDEAERRRKSRQHLGYGKVIRTLAQLHFRRFDADQAAEKIELAMNATRSAAHYLTYAGALEVKATVVGVLGGDLRNALQLVNDAIEENQRAGYAPGVSWAVQTRSFMHALAGDTGSMEADLAWVSRLGCNPNQERRTEFIRLIGRWCGNASQYETDAETAERLRARYEDAGNAWYPGILSLLIAAIRGTARGDGAGASDYFKEDIDQKGLISSFLFRVISSPRERPAPRVI